MLIERKAERRCRCGFPHYMTLAGELMFGNEPPKSPDALDRKPLARTAQEFRGTRPVIVIASGQRECVPDDSNPFFTEQRKNGLLPPSLFAMTWRVSRPNFQTARQMRVGIPAARFARVVH
jgi:hypothetical protein